MVNVVKVLKVAGKFVGPVVAGVMTVMTEIESQKLKDTVKDLAKKVAELEKK